MHPAKSLTGGGKTLESQGVTNPEGCGRQAPSADVEFLSTDVIPRHAANWLRIPAKINRVLAAIFLKVTSASLYS